jgi:hypothetical protein
VPDLWRWENQRLPANRSFLDVVNGTRDPLRNAADAARNDGPDPAKDTRAFGLSLPRPMVLCAAVAIVGLCGSIYCAVGYVHYQHAAGTERAAAQRAERANADLQNALDGMRDQLTVAKAQIDTLAGDAKPPVAVSKHDSADRAAQLTRGLGPPDLQLTDPRSTIFAANLSWETTKLPDGHLQQSWARIELNEAEGKIQQLGAEYDAVIGERDQLREHLGELEEKLALLQAPQAPRQAAKVPPNSTSGSSAGGGLAAIAFPRSAVAGPAAEQSPQVFKNFTAPGSVPNYFSDESGAILGRPTAASGREQR